MGIWVHESPGSSPVMSPSLYRWLCKYIYERLWWLWWNEIRLSNGHG